MRYLLFFAVLFFSQNVFAQNEIDQTFEKFWSQFKKDLKAGKKEKIADVFIYPFNSLDWYYLISPGGDIDVDMPRNMILENYDKIFTPAVVKTLLKSEPVKTDLYGEDVIAYTAIYYKSPTSASWVVFFKEGDTWKLSGTDNISYE